MGTPISSLGERRLIREIWSLLRSYGFRPKTPSGTFDDAVGIRIGDRWLILSNDGVSRGTDMLPGMSWEDLGWRLGVVCVSDLAAKSAEPLGMLVSLNLPGNMNLDAVRTLYRGLIDAALEYKFEIWGGDIGEAEEVLIDGFLVGLSANPIWRYGTRPGDLIVTTGEFGLTGAAFHYLLRGGTPASERCMQKILRATYRPRARLKAGLMLGSIKGVRASIDSSDGLAISLHELASVNKLGILIEHVPVAEEAVEYAEANSINPLDLALYGGDEYELVIAVAPESVDSLMKELEGLGLSPSIIGRVVEGEGVFLRTPKGLEKVAALGWEHLKSAK